MALLDQVDLTGVATLSGTAREVSGKLTQRSDQQVVAFVLPSANVQQRDAIARTLEIWVEETAGHIVRRNKEALETLVSLLVPAVSAPKSALREAQMIARARTAVLDSAEWLTAAQVAELANLSPTNPNAQTSRWKKERKIFSVKPPGSVELFPAYGLNPEAGFRPVPALADVIEVFGARKDSWGMAYWFSSINSFLGGKRPQDLLTTTPNRVIEAARDEAQDVSHG